MNANDVVDWREALVRLSDQHFFDLMRMYLGAIRTPFNKQRLVEELSSFLRKREHRERIVASLDEFDLMILSAIHELPSPTQQKIVSLFAGSRSFPEIYDRILNLEERLIVYRRSDADHREYALTPLLADEILPSLGRHVLVPPAEPGEPVSAPLRIDDLTLAALYSFFLQEGDAVKNDGSFRKKTRETLEAVFPQLYDHPECLRHLIAAFQNLGLFVRVEGRLVPDPQRWESFSRIGARERIAYLVAAAGGRIQRDSMQVRAQLCLDFLESLEPGARYARDTVTRLAFLLSEQSGRTPVGRANGRFAAIIREQEAALALSGAETDAGMADIAFSFGLLIESGGFWIRNSALDASPAGSAPTPYLVVSPSFAVTLMPGFSLAELLPLAVCMEVRDIQIAGQFEITRRSCNAAFAQGVPAERVVALLRERSAQALPGNVEFSILDWYGAYASVSLYHGFILRVDENRRALFEHNEHLSALILKTLAPGVYLLDAAGPEEISEAFSLAGLESPPGVCNPAPKRETLSLPALRLGRSPAGGATTPAVHAGTVPPSDSPAMRPDPAGASRRRDELFAALDALALDPEMAESLRSRIERRIVISADQLDPESVRVEKLEARGMDFLGKVRIAEYALVSGSLLEILLDEKNGNRALLGRPVSTEKRTGDVLLKLVLEPDHAVEVVSLGKAVMVRRIRGSIFSELPAGRG